MGVDARRRAVDVPCVHPDLLIRRMAPARISAVGHDECVEEFGPRTPEFWEAGGVTDTDELWGGRLTGIAFDPVDWQAELDVEVHQAGHAARYRVVLEGVTDWRASRVTELPWTYAETTEWHVASANPGVVVEVVMWEDATSLTLRCADVAVERLA